MSQWISSKVIDEQAKNLEALAKTIWENPEMGWHETTAVEATAKYLEEQGFAVEVGAYGMPTAIRAVWGSGHPVMGFCAEYDCLPGLSQKVDTKQNPVVKGAQGHGCGHNLLGVGCAGACVGLKAELEASGKEGTVIFYGCPAEEQLTGKGFMAKAGAFKECDFTVAWHPAVSNRNTLGVNNGVEGAIFHFHGRTAHAAGNPQDGRSALDALQLMNLGVEFLHEHTTSDVRIHYCILDGGLAPNVVPEHASSKLFVRAQTREAIMDTFERVMRCAKGAAYMTETELSVERLGGIYPTMQNPILARVMQQVREQIPLVEWTKEELAFADAINRTSPSYVEGVTPPIDDQLAPLERVDGFGSTDYGDVQHICPGIQNRDCTAATLAGGHNWRVTSCAGSSIGIKGMIRAAKVMAAGAYRMAEDPALVEQAKREFALQMQGTVYECPITDDVAWPYSAPDGE